LKGANSVDNGLQMAKVVDIDRKFKQRGLIGQSADFRSADVRLEIAQNVADIGEQALAIQRLDSKVRVVRPSPVMRPRNRKYAIRLIFQ
jgi:hypothetical protein